MVEQIQIQQRKDKQLSYLCYRGNHIKCKGRTCTCDCHNH